MFFSLILLKKLDVRGEISVKKKSFFKLDCHDAKLIPMEVTFEGDYCVILLCTC